MNMLSIPATKHVEPETRDASTPPSKDAHDFKSQLENAIVPSKDPHDLKLPVEKAKPAKKLADELVAPVVQPPIAQPDPSSLVQIIASLLTGAAKPDAEPLPAALPDAPKPIAALTADVATASAKAVATDAAQGAPDKLVQQMVAVAPEPAESAQPAMTPLEQAVHDLLSELADKKAPAHEATTTPVGATFQLAPATTIAAPEAKPDVQPTASVAPAPPPAELVSQNHAHLVLDDANGRVVLTVAVRGSEVNVSVRATDDATAASLARNAASLDDAMRGRGLQLAQFDAQRDLAREQHAEKPKYERETVKKSNAERFTLEENL